MCARCIGLRGIAIATLVIRSVSTTTGGRGQREEHVVRSLEGEQPSHPRPHELTGAVGGQVGTGVELDVEEHGRQCGRPAAVVGSDA